MAKAPKKEPLPKSVVDALPAALDCFKLLTQATRTVDRDVRAQLHEADCGGPMQLARAYVTLHRLNDAVDEFKKTFSKLFEEYKTSVVPDSFDEQRTEMVPLSEGYRVTTSTKIQASINAQRKPDAYAWLREHQMGGLIQETVSASALSTDLGVMIKDDNVDPPIDLFNVHFATLASVTAFKPKK